MAGRFEGLSDEQWSIFSDIVPRRTNKLGRAPSSAREVLNTILYVLITGCRWCDIPIGEQWGKRSTAHDRLITWQQDGTFEKIKRHVLALAELIHGIDWERGSIDGFFSLRQRRWSSGSVRPQG
jgi:transposase